MKIHIFILMVIAIAAAAIAAATFVYATSRFIATTPAASNTSAATVAAASSSAAAFSDEVISSIVNSIVLPSNQTFVISKIVHVLSKTGRYKRFASVLSHWSNDTSILPVSFTLFAPIDGYTGYSWELTEVCNHICPLQLTKAALLSYPPTSFIHTMYSDCVKIEGKYGFNLSIGGAQIIEFEIFQTSKVSVHGISRPLVASDHSLSKYKVIDGCLWSIVVACYITKVHPMLGPHLLWIQFLIIFILMLFAIYGGHSLWQDFEV